MVDQEDPWSGEALIITDVSSSRVILLSQDNHQDVSTRLYFGVLLRSHSPGIQAERDVNNAAAGDTTVFCYIQKMLVVISRQDSCWRNACPLKKNSLVIAAGRK